MALSSKSLILYGFEVTTLNRSLDFKAVSGGPTLLATLRLGFYSLTSLASEIARALFSADNSHIYTCSVNRSVSGGLENRVVISTTSSFFSLLFSTGPRSASTIAPLIGFNASDYTGSTSYSGSSSAGVPLIPSFPGYNYLDPSLQKKVMGNVNVSSSGQKEAIVFQLQKFINVEFKYESRSRIVSEWEPFMNWAIQQRRFEFTPEITDPNTIYDVTLEKTDFDGKGLGYQMKELLPQFPNLYTTGALQFRVAPL